MHYKINDKADMMEALTKEVHEKAASGKL